MNTWNSAGSRIASEVQSWSDVTSGVGSRGEFAFRVDGREIGHPHGDSAAHFFREHTLWGELRAAGRICDHPMFPGKAGPAARRILGDDDVSDVIAVIRLNHDRVRSRTDGGM